MKKTIGPIMFAYLGSALPSQGTTFASQTVVTNSAQDVSGVYTADIDGDGDIDIVASHHQTNTAVTWYANGGNGTFGPAQAISSSLPGAMRAHLGDIDSDGDIDVVAASFYGDQVVWYANNGSGTFGPPNIVSSSTLGAWDAFCADVDSDGDTDILSASYYDNSISWHPNSGPAGFGTRQIITNQADGAQAVSAADIDGDGDPDVVFASYNNTSVAWHENLGSGFWGPQQIIDQGYGGGARDVATVDIDNDGDYDVLAAHASSNAVLYQNLGGSFAPRQVLYTSTFTGLSVHAADFDGDGDSDVIAGSTNNLVFIENLGGGAFGPIQILDTAYAEGVASADLNDNNAIDVIAGLRTSDTIATYTNLQTPPLSGNTTPYGSGCGSPAMAFSPTANAITGQSLAGTISNTPTAFCYVAFGSSNTVAPGLGALPIDLSPAGMTGCTLYQSNDIFGLPTASAGVAFQMNFSMPIPSDPLLVGQHIYLQAFSIAPGANPFQWIASNGIDFLIGNQ